MVRRHHMAVRTTGLSRPGAGRVPHATTVGAAWDPNRATPREAGRVGRVEDLNFDAPLPGDGREREEAKKRALGLRLDEARGLTSALDADLSADAWGYAQLADIEDEVQRATVSDQIRSAAHGIEENLVEARLHELDVSALVGPHGVPMPYENASVNDHLRNDRLEMNTAGFFRAFGSTLDCLAAVLIGVVRIPMSLRFAEMGALARFDPATTGKLVPDDVSGAQRDAWDDLVNLLDDLRRREPAGWYVWGLELRNAMLHRGRGVRAFLPRPRRTRLQVVTDTPLPALLRFDYYLRKRPWLPDLVQLARAESAGDVWIHEPVQDTLRGLFEHLSGMVAELATWALAQWADQAETPTFSAPTAAWQLGREPDTDFAGFAERRTGAEFDAIMVGPGGVEPLRLAEQLRLRLAQEREQGQ